MKNLIEKLNLTIKEFAELYEIPYNTVRQWYNGTRQAPLYIKKMIETIIELKSKGKMDPLPIITMPHPKYVYVFYNKHDKFVMNDVVLRRFTDNENVRECEDSFWKKRYNDELDNPERECYRYTLTEETKIEP